MVLAASRRGCTGIVDEAVADHVQMGMASSPMMTAHGGWLIGRSDIDTVCVLCQRRAS